MGYIDLDGDKLRVLEANAEDVAGIRAGIRAYAGADELTAAMTFDAANPFNVAALWCAALPWREAALQKALETIMPLAVQQMAMFNPGRFASLRKWMPGADGSRPGPPKPSNQ